MLEQVRNELRQREADNDNLHKATLALLAANLERAQGRIEGERTRAAESHDERGVQEAEEKLRRAQDVFEKEVTIEGQRYDTARAAIDKELKALDDVARRHESESVDLERSHETARIDREIRLASERREMEDRHATERGAVEDRHAAQRAAMESFYAPTVEPEVPPAPRIPEVPEQELDNRDPVEGAIDLGVRTVAAVLNLPSTEDPVELDDRSQEAIAEAMKMTWRDLKTRAPDDVQHLFPLSPLERELRVQESARQPESMEGQLLADREFVEQQQAKASEKDQRAELDERGVPESASQREKRGFEETHREAVERQQARELQTIEKRQTRELDALKQQQQQGVDELTQRQQGELEALRETQREELERKLRERERDREERSRW